MALGSQDTATFISPEMFDEILASSSLSAEIVELNTLQQEHNKMKEKKNSTQS